MSSDPSRNDPLRRVILLRHGRTEWNAQRRWQGHLDVPLDAMGLRQAERAAQVLVQDTSITTVVTSDLARAVQTSAVVRGAFDLAGRPLRRSVDASLREIDMGQWSGLTHVEVAQRFPQESAAVSRGEDVRRGIDGETMGEAVGRGSAAVRDAVRTLGVGETVLVVTHGALIRGVVADLVGMDFSVLRQTFVSLGNCHWVSLCVDAERWRIEQWNVGVVDSH